MADPEANVIYGIVTDESMGDAVKVTVIATGFTNRGSRKVAPTPVDLANYVGPRAQPPAPLPQAEVGGLLSQDARTPRRRRAAAARLDLDVPAFLRKQGGGGSD